jgi:hypothetical protein
LPASREKSPQNPDRRSDHSFFTRAIAAIGNAILPVLLSNFFWNNEGSPAMTNHGPHCDRPMAQGYGGGARL